MNLPRKTRSAVTFVTGALIAGVVLSGCGSDDSAAGSNTVNVSLPNHTWTTAIQKLAPKFEQETGLKLNITTFGEDQLSDQYNVKLNTKTKDFDVMMFRPLQEGRLFIDNGWLSKIDDRVKADSAWNWADFQPEPVKSVTAADGAIYGVPLVTEREVLYYNKEILDKGGVKVPRTLDELKAAAAKLNKRDEGVFGFIARGQRAPSVTQFSSYLYSFGGDFAVDGKAALNTPAAQKAYEYYGSMLRDYGPPGTTEMGWPQALPVFAQGKVAFYTDADSLYNNFNDPATSKITGKVGFAQFPAGPAGSKPYNIPSWALGINEYSTNKDNAWKFVQWATSPATSLEVQASGVPLARTSVWDDPKGMAGFPKELAEVIRSSSKAGIGHDRPQVIKVGEARDIVGTPIVESIGGGDVAAALAKAQKDYQALLDTEKR